MYFVINGIEWQIQFVPANSDMLRRSDGSITCGMTDGVSNTVYLSENLQGAFLRKVICHEVCHTAMFSYGIHMSIEQEELFCDLISTYGDEIIGITDDMFRILKERVA